MQVLLHIIVGTIGFGKQANVYFLTKDLLHIKIIFAL